MKAILYEPCPRCGRAKGTFKNPSRVLRPGCEVCQGQGFLSREIDDPQVDIPANTSDR